MPNPENLVDLRTRTPAERKRIASMGGQVKSIKKRVARRITALKKSGISNSKISELVDLMESPEITQFDILIYIQQMKTIAGNDINGMNMVAKTFLQWSKQWHGDKSSVVNQQFNIAQQPVVINIIKNGELETDD